MEGGMRAEDVNDDDTPTSEISEDSIEAEGAGQDVLAGTIERTSTPVVEKIDLSGILPNHDELSKSSGYISDKVSSTPKSTGRWVGSDVSELQDIMSLDACLGSTIFTQDQQNKSLEESGRTLMDHGQFQDAAVLLDAVNPITFRQQLLLAECYLYTNQRPYVKVSIDHAARLMTLSLRLRIQDVSTAIKKALARKNFVKALLLLHCSPRFAYLKMVPNDAVRFIERRVADYSHAVTAMVKAGGKSREYAEWFVTHNMLDILLLFREITQANFEKKIDCEGRIFTYFGLCYRAIDDHQKSLECFQQGMEVLSLTFDDRVMNSKLYGILLHNTALVYESLNDYSGAESHYVQAHEALTYASDFESPKDKEVTVKVTETNLKILRDKMEVLALVEVSSDSTDELLQVDNDPESTSV